MRLYIDTQTDQLVSGPGTNDPLRSIDIKRGITARIEVQFLAGPLVVERPDAASGIFEIKSVGKYDAGPLAEALSWTKVGTGSDTYYFFTPNLNTVPLNALLGHGDGNTANDKVSVTCMAEIQWIEAGVTRKTQTIEVVIANDVIKDTDGTPLEMPSPEDWLADRIPPPLELTANPVNGVLGRAQSAYLRLTGVAAFTGNWTLGFHSPGFDYTLVFVHVVSGDTAADIRDKVIAACNASSEFSQFAVAIEDEDDDAKAIFKRLVEEGNTEDFNIAEPSGVGGLGIDSGDLDEGLAPIPGTVAVRLGQDAIVTDVATGFLRTFRCLRVTPVFWRSFPGVQILDAAPELGVLQVLGIQVTGTVGTTQTMVMTLHDSRGPDVTINVSVIAGEYETDVATKIIAACEASSAFAAYATVVNPGRGGGIFDIVRNIAVSGTGGFAFGGSADGISTATVYNPGSAGTPGQKGQIAIAGEETYICLSETAALWKSITTEVIP